MLDAIYQTMLQIIRSKNLSNESSIYKFIEELDQDTYGAGCVSIDLADYLKTEDEILLFARLFKESVDFLKEHCKWQEERYQHALKLYHILVTT